MATARGGTFAGTITRGDGNGDGVTVVIQPELFESFEDRRVVRSSQSDVIRCARANNVVQTVACAVSVGVAISGVINPAKLGEHRCESRSTDRSEAYFVLRLCDWT